MFQEEEDEYIEEESDIDDDDADNRLKEANDQSVLNTKWRQAIVKDLARHSDKGAPGLGSCDSLDRVLGAAADTRQGKLSLREVAHIRRVLARAELEAEASTAPDLRLELEAGRLCGVCRRSRLAGPASLAITRGRGEACELCGVLACSGCVARAGRVTADMEYHIRDIPRHLLGPAPAPAAGPGSRHNCAGSAPSSPAPARAAASEAGHESLPLPPLVTSRWSVAGPWQPRLEAGVRVCLDCSSMVKQVPHQLTNCYGSGASLLIQMNHCRLLQTPGSVAAAVSL